MATFVTLFVATQRQLDRIFPGWPRPASEPTLERVEDPFTGEETTVLRWHPPQGVSSEIEPATFDHSASAIAPVLPAESDFERDMEARAPSVLRSLPHACLKNLFNEHLMALGSLLMGRRVDGRPERVTPDGFALDCLAQEAVAALAAAEQEQLEPLARRWATEAGSGFESTAEALWVVRRIQALARLCTQAERGALCLWVEM